MKKNNDQLYLASLLYGLGVPIDVYCRDVSSKDIETIELCYALSVGKSEGRICKDSQRERLVPITETIGMESINSCEYSMPTMPVSLSLDYFPLKGNKEKKDYSALLNSLLNDLEVISRQEPRAFADSLLSLLEKHTSCIPYSSEEVTDTSMFDYIKASTAMATCLSAEGIDEEKQFLLVGADFSGIQSYIYQIVSKYAGKNLKGRSFYVRLLSDAVVRYILLKLNLYKANVIYNSGGGFYLLTPNTAKTKELLAEAVKEIEKNFFNTHGTSIYAAIDYVELSAATLRQESNQTLSDVWGELFKKRDQKKNHKFSSVIAENPSVFFNATNQGGDVKIDSISGEEIRADDKCFVKEGLTLKEITKSQIDLGSVLKDTVLMVCSDSEIEELKNCINVNPAELGIRYYFLLPNDVHILNNISSTYDYINVIALNGINYDWQALNLPNNASFTFEFYGGNEFNGKTFEKMASGEGLNRLGVLRMDVDNLGNIFQQGIPQHRATLARYAALSRSFDYFFSGYLNTIWQEVSPDRTFIIYSGGDDVFVVGRWDKTIEMAKRIREDFRRFTCGNKAFSISGGVAIVSPKFPIMKAAEQSGDEESNAKNHVCVGSTKNSLSFMQIPLNWDKEFNAVEALKFQLVEYLNADVLPSSFLSKVLQHHANARIQNHKITNYKTFWMLTYDLSRMKSRIKESVVKELIENCKTEVVNKRTTLNGMPIATDYQGLELWAMACRWAELETRTE